jgi:Rps23 Pro-64 3,4-dihydroxylase Tpa1-like proline 4-hydroxylase
MQLIDFVQIFDKPIKESTCESILIYAKNNPNFKSAGILKVRTPTGVEDKRVRDTEHFSPSQLSSSMTEIHWANFIMTMMNQAKMEYLRRLRIRDFPCSNQVDIQFLRYGEGGHYQVHVDDAPEIPRTLSMIYLLNDDYEGGELTLYTPDQQPIYKLPVKKNQLIVWPSSFMYPHGVAPVKKGVRYSIVSWTR